MAERKGLFDACETLCWSCEKASGGCSWSKNFTPVDGWKAIPTVVCTYQTKLASGQVKKYAQESFNVQECPEFELMQYIKDNLGKPGFNNACIKKAVTYYKRLLQEREKK